MSPTEQPSEVDVLVVGAGPNGVTAGNLLAMHGVRVHVVEANALPSGEPRAVALADESLRTAHTLDVLDELRPDLVWSSGSCYFGSKGQLLARTQPAASRHGFPVKTLFDQPGYVRALLCGLERRDLATIEFRAAVVGIGQGDDTAEVAMRTPDGKRSVRARYVMACDGARSTVRELLGIRMEGSSQTHPWIVIDTIEDPRDNGDTEFHCDPLRPHVIVPGTRGRCRYEFMLMPHDDPDDVLTLTSIQRLIGPYRRIGQEQIRRAAIYVAHQLVASRWRDGRAFLAGDAAHLMPPFAGQGLNTGLRDVRNLCWKLAAVVQKQGDDALLDTYETERRPHAEAMISLSSQVGRIVMTRSALVARVRDLVFNVLRLVPPARRHLTELRFLPRSDVSGGVAVQTGGDDGSLFPGLVGEPLPQGMVIDAFGRVMLLDDVLGTGWALIAVAERQTIERVKFPARLADLVGASTVVVLPPGRIPRPQAPARVVAEELPRVHSGRSGVCEVPERFLLVRPDRYVAADFTTADVDVVTRHIAAYIIPSSPSERVPI